MPTGTAQPRRNAGAHKRPAGMAAAEAEILRLREEVKVLRGQAAGRDDEGKDVDTGQEDRLRRLAEDCEAQMKEAQREAADLR